MRFLAGDDEKDREHSATLMDRNRAVFSPRALRPATNSQDILN